MQCLHACLRSHAPCCAMPCILCTHPLESYYTQSALDFNPPPPPPKHTHTPPQEAGSLEQCRYLFLRPICLFVLGTAEHTIHVHLTTQL